MNEDLTSNRNATLGGVRGSLNVEAARRHKVLRNTLWLLAISLVPTVLGAWIGLRTGIANGLTGGLGLIVFLGGAFAFIFGIEKNRNNGLGVALLLAFTFFMGVMLSRMLGWALGFSNGTQLVMTAFGGTASIFFVMASLATVIKRDISGWGSWLFAGVLVMLVGGVINLLLVQSSALAIGMSFACIAIFTAYLLYDMKRILDGGETSYISATLALYLDLFNIFQNLLFLLGVFSGDD